MGLRISAVRALQGDSSRVFMAKVTHWVVGSGILRKGSDRKYVIRREKYPNWRYASDL